MTNVIVVIGAGQIGQAIARGVGVAKHILLADLRLESANAAAEVMTNAGYELSVATCDLSSRQSVYALVDAATQRAAVTGLIHAASVSPAQRVPRNHSEGRPLRHCIGARRSWQGDRRVWFPRRHIFAVRTPASRAFG